jgi:ketosteroid isomerase-like protein
MRRWSLLVSLLVLAAPAPAALCAVQKMTGDPPMDLVALISAERRFAARATETSIRDAFFEALDDNAILFHPGPVNGKEWYRGRPSNPGPLLRWEPTYAEISQFGDLGWTTGPWEYTGKDEKKPSAFGHFATVWQLGLDHKWHVLIDYGISHPKSAPESLAFARIGGDKVPEHVISLKELLSASTSLDAADRAYSQALVKAGVGAALAQSADADVRVYRDEAAPYLGPDAAGKALAHEWDRGATAWKMTPGAIAKSGDLAFTYGTVDLPAGKKDEPTRRNVMRFWRRAPGEGWKLALDVTLAVPPDAPAPPPAPAPKQP